MKKFTLLFAAILAVSMSFATTVTKTVESLATELSWTNGTVCTPFALDNAITVSTTATDANTGKYYSNGQQIRLYQSGSATITLTAGEGYSISSVALTYASQNTGILLDATGATYESGTDFAVNAQAVTFSVGNSGEATNGQARVTEFSVTYTGAGADTTSQDTTPVIVPVETETLLFNANIWNVADVNEKYAAWIWGDSLEGQWTDFFTPVDAENTYGVQIPVTADSIIFVRLDVAIDTVNWNNLWNRTIDYAINHADMYFTVEGWGEGENAKSYGTWGTPVVITSLADAKLLAVGTEITTTGIVTYINNKNAYIQDATDGILLFSSAKITNFQVGDEIVIDAKVASYGNAPELSNVVLRNIVSSENTVNPILMTLAERVANPLQNFGMMVTINELTITAYDNYSNPTLSDGENTVAGYKFSLDTAAFPIGSVVDVTAIAAYYNAIQVQGDPAGVVLHEYPAPLVMDTITFVPTMWNAADAKVAAWVWGDSLEGMWTEMITLDTLVETYVMEVPVLAQNIKFVRFASNVAAPAWQDVEIWNQTGDKVMDFETALFTITDWNDGIWGTPEPEPVFYFIKNNWNGGEWAWMPMVFDTIQNHWEFIGVYGGTGVNINTVADGEGLFFADTAWVLADSNFVPQYLDTLRFCYLPETDELHVHLMGRPAAVPPTFFIKNNWNGGDNWLWEVMTLDTAANVYEYTGVWGGEGVNISDNQDPEYPHSFWFPAESFVMVDSAVVAQAMDTLHFMFTPADTTLMVALVGRPEPDPEVFMIKNNWNGGEWMWMEMEHALAPHDYLWYYVGVFGGTGVNITSNYMDTILWFPVENWVLADSGWIPAPMDSIAFEYNAQDSAVVAMLVSRPAPAPEVFQIKNNWNGGEEWTWVDMTPVEGQENIYEYTGVFGGTGVDIKSNYMDSRWFPVDSFLLNDSALVPQAMDTVLFAYNSALNEVAAMVLGRPEPVVLDTVVTGVHIINETGWAQLNLYMWGQAGELFGEWPGQTLNEDYVAEGVEGNYFALIGPFEGLEENLIFNNGNGVQFRDLTITLVDTVYEIVVRADGAYFADQVPAEALTIAEATATEIGTELQTRGIVTYINNKNAYIQDATAGILLYGTAAFANQFSVGDEIIVSAKRAEYGGAPELSYVTLDTILSFGNTVTPIRMTLAERAAEPFKNFGMMVTVKNLTISAFDNYNTPTLTDGENSAVCYKMNVDTTVFHIGDIVDITAIAGYFNAIQFQGDVAGITMHVDDQYFIKNNWDGGDWTWGEMTQSEMFDYQYEYTGVFGGTGVNINTAAADEGSIWFPIENFDIDTEGLVPQAGDTVYFNFNSFDETLYAYVVGRPEVITVQYFIKNNWNGGEWTWEIMTPANDENITWMYQGVFGGTGVNINTAASDADALWFPVDQWILTTLGYEPAAGDEILFEYDSEESTLTATFKGQDGLETITFEREGETVKVIMNGQLYIVRDGKVYNALGAQVR